MKNKPWSNYKEWKKKGCPERYELIDMAKKFRYKDERALFILLYLTGARISEIIQERYARKVIYKKEITIDEAGNKTSKVARNAFKSPIADKVRVEEINFEGIARKHIMPDFRNGRKILIIKIPNRKNRKRKDKRIPIPYDKEQEFLNMLHEYIDKLEPDDLLFHFGKTKAEKIIKKNAGMTPHFLRDIRATRLVIDYNFTEYKLMQYMGWTDGRPASRYVMLNTNSLLGGDY